MKGRLPIQRATAEAWPPRYARTPPTRRDCAPATASPRSGAAPWPRGRRRTPGLPHHWPAGFGPDDAAVLAAEVAALRRLPKATACRSAGRDGVLARRFGDPSPRGGVPDPALLADFGLMARGLDQARGPNTPAGLPAAWKSPTTAPGDVQPGRALLGGGPGRKPFLGGRGRRPPDGHRIGAPAHPRCGRGRASRRPGLGLLALRTHRGTRAVPGGRRPARGGGRPLGARGGRRPTGGLRAGRGLQPHDRRAA
jgi:hypothetical protein